MSTHCNDNISTTERVMRGFVGLVLLEVILLVPVSASVIAILSMVALYLVFTAIMAWDPVNLLGKKAPSTQVSRARVHSMKPSHT